MNTQQIIETNNLALQWSNYQQQHPKIRIREAAVNLGISEAELVAVRCGNENIRLRTEFGDILKALKKLGKLLAVTRNDFIVHEIRGQYLQMQLRGNVGMFFPPGLDTRFFFDSWQSVFAVNEGGQFSIQFFDRYGIAAHKVYMTQQTPLKIFHQLVKDFQSNLQSTTELVEPLPVKVKAAALDAEELHDKWAAMRDVQEASRLIKTLAAGDNQQVYRALGGQYACPLQVNIVEQLFETLAQKKMDLMILVMGRAAVQSYAGKIHQILRAGPWFTILDAEFNLHIKSDGIASVWLVRKPTDDGWITSLDIFDQQGNELMVICDNRSRCRPEKTVWTDTLLEVAVHFHLRRGAES